MIGWDGCPENKFAAIFYPDIKPSAQKHNVKQISSPLLKVNGNQF
jgi:hypothetical protein